MFINHEINFFKLIYSTVNISFSKHYFLLYLEPEKAIRKNVIQQNATKIIILYVTLFNSLSLPLFKLPITGIPYQYDILININDMTIVKKMVP